MLEGGADLVKAMIEHKPNSLRLPRGDILKALEMSAECLKALESSGSVCFDQDDSADVGDVVSAMMNASLQVVTDAHRILLTTIGGLSDGSTTMRDAALILDDSARSARIMREAICDHAEIIQAMYSELLDILGKHIVPDLLGELGGAAP